jgi:ComF family protein
MALLSRLLTHLLDALSPPGCAACDAPLAGTAAATFCAACGTLLTPEGPQSVAGVPLIVAGSYAPPLSTAIVRFKYEGRAELCRDLAQLLAPALDRLELAADACLVPVPLHPRRLATRGYNQAALLAQELARGRERCCEPRLLCRTREVERQVGKARAARLTNTEGVFALREGALMRAGGGCGRRRAVLVDDVVTTGSTVRACAQALAAGGVELTAVIAVAVALPD